MDAAPFDGWSGSWHISLDDDAAVYGIQIEFPLPDGALHAAHAKVPRGDPPFTIVHEAGTLTLDGAPGERSGAATFSPNASVAEQWRARLGRALTDDEQLCNALFDVTLDFDTGFRALFPRATPQNEVEARVFGADLALLREVAAANPNATPRDVTIAAMRRRRERGR